MSNNLHRNVMVVINLYLYTCERYILLQLFNINKYPNKAVGFCINCRIDE